MSDAKIRLSPKEKELITNADFILTKNTLLQKVNGLLVQLLEKQQLYIDSVSYALPRELANTSPKISKGENYQGLPYLVLDFPRFFEKEEICAVRTLFWWGHFFSVTLHLSGKYKNKQQDKIIAAFEGLRAAGFYCCIHPDQWEHHFDSANYQQLSTINHNDFRKLIGEKSFIKLAAKIPLESWDNAEELLLVLFKQLTGLLPDQPPRR